MRSLSVREIMMGEFGALGIGGGGLGEPGYEGRTADGSKPPGWTPNNPRAWDPYFDTPGGDPFDRAFRAAARQTQEPWIKESKMPASPGLQAQNERGSSATDSTSSQVTAPTTILRGLTPINQFRSGDGTLWNYYEVTIGGITYDAYAKRFEPDAVILVRVPEWAAGGLSGATQTARPTPAGPSTSAPAPLAGGGYSIKPPPPIRGGTSDALYFKPGWSQVYQNSRQAAQKADPDLHEVYSGLIVSPLAYLEGLLNVPHTVVNKVITAEQHLDRGSLWLQQDEWGEAAAEGLEAVVDLSLAFLDVAALAEETPASVPHECPRASLAEEIPAGVPQKYAGDVSNVTGTPVEEALSRMSDRAIAQHHLFNVNAANVLNDVPYLRDAWRRDLGNLNQEGLVRSLAENPASQDLYLGIKQKPGQSVPDLLHTGSGTGKPFLEVTSMNPTTVADHRGRWYWQYSDPLLYPNAPPGWNIWQAPGGRRLRTWNASGP